MVGVGVSFQDSTLWVFIRILSIVTVVVLIVVGIWQMFLLYKVLRERGRRADMALLELRVALVEAERDPRGKARLAIAEKEYLESVKQYNQQVTLIQSHLVGKIFKVRQREILTVDELKKSELMVK